MSLQTFSLDEKIEMMEVALKHFRDIGIRAADRSFYDAIKAILIDLQARQEFPQGHALGTLRRALKSAKNSKTSLGYETRSLIFIANVVIQHWPTIEQALEQFGEESAE